MENEFENNFSIGDNEKVGDYLRRVREARGVELEHLAKAIRLGKNILESIEANRWSDFPTEAYLRSYIISLCEKLLIDKYAVISRFSLEINSHFAVSQANMMSEQNQEETPVGGGNVSKIAIIVAVVVVVVAFFAKQMLDDSNVAAPVVEESLKLEPQALADEEAKQDELAAKDSAAVPNVIAPPLPAVDPNAMDTLRLECTHSATDNTCGLSLKGFDTKMSYFTRSSSRNIKHNDTSQVTITVPLRTKLFINGNKVEYGKFNTLYFYQGQIVNKLNRELR